jgi:hypothetical protein
MAMNAVFLSDEEIIRVTNEEFITVKRDDLAGRVDIKLHISTVESDNIKAEELAFMLQTIGPNSDPDEVRMIRSEIARLRKMPELAKRIEEYQPQPDPIQQRLGELEVELKEAEIRKTLSEAIENEAEAELDMARAREADSKTDNEDLKFVETSEGVTHARDMQQDGAQARANMDLKVLDHALKGGNGAGNTSTTP